MTKDEQVTLQARVNQAVAVRQRLDQAEMMLKALQGSLVCEQYEVVAEQLTQVPVQAVVIGISFYTANREYPVRWSTPMPKEVTQLLVWAFRALVRHLRAEYEVC